jgi:hypothetical protein
VIAAAVAVVGCGGGGDGGALPTTAPPATTAASAPTSAPASRAAPRWETVVTLEGTGPARTAAFTILDDAIQWRVRWTCEAGALTIAADPPPRKGRPVAEGACPGKGDGFAIHTGRIRLDVDTTGPWVAIVDQQVDTPLAEAPLEGMSAETVVAEGRFVPVEMDGTGTARLYELADGRRFLRFEDDFRVTTNTDLFVWLSRAEAPATSEEAVASPYVDLGNLKSTVGSQNYQLPGDVPTDAVRSIVIWCEPVAIAYAAAPLARA